MLENYVGISHHLNSGPNETTGKLFAARAGREIMRDMMAEIEMFANPKDTRV